MNERLKIAVNTGGGDAPGLNAVIYAVTMASYRRGWEVYGIQTGYAGLLDTEQIIRLTPEKVTGIVSMGGTILGTTNKGDPFRLPFKNALGEIEIRDVSDKIVSNFKRLGLDVLIAIGGDGSLRIAHRFAQMGMPVVGVPKTIDNDLASTIITFGFDTAVSTATEAIDKLHSTASAHERVMVVEVMGRNAGWIALNSGTSGSADVILIPEIPFRIKNVCDKIMNNELRGKRYGIVVAAEGARAEGGEVIHKGKTEDGRQDVLLGGIGEWVAREIQQQTGKDTRSLVLGHLQRGGSPTTFDRLLALRFGAAAVRFIAEGRRNVMVASAPPDMATVPLEVAVEKMKSVPLDSDSILTARDMGISFGDE
ncbi:MAG: ATP-dependent 6-phosphofructokinase [Deltaproteobacteria bacterium]|nr:ATP-dependent 6-phosphofructokinase [Deltaproteobacteria bacterium]